MGWRTTAQNFNLNRDYMKADAPEMQAMLGLVRTWDPLTMVDLHTTDGAQFEHDIAIMVEPVNAGDAALRAVQEGVADRNPYDGIEPGQLNLWGPDSYHFGPWGSYLEALVIFGKLTGRDPQSLGADSRAGRDLGLTPAQVEAAQRIAARELRGAASPGAPSRP